MVSVLYSCRIEMYASSATVLVSVSVIYTVLSNTVGATVLVSISVTNTVPSNRVGVAERLGALADATLLALTDRSDVLRADLNELEGMP